MPDFERDSSAIHVSYLGRYALVVIDHDKKLNALSQAQYYDLGRRLDEVALHDEVFVTVLTARGRYFSASVTDFVSWSRTYWLTV